VDPWRVGVETQLFRHPRRVGDDAVGDEKARPFERPNDSGEQPGEGDRNPPFPVQPERQGDVTAGFDQHRPAGESRHQNGEEIRRRAEEQHHLLVATEEHPAHPELVQEEPARRDGQALPAPLAREFEDLVSVAYLRVGGEVGGHE
jgi:hypothetical protein